MLHALKRQNFKISTATRKIVLMRTHRCWRAGSSCSGSRRQRKMHTVAWHQKTAGSRLSDPEQDLLRAPPAGWLTRQGESSWKRTCARQDQSGEYRDTVSGKTALGNETHLKGSKSEWWARYDIEYPSTQSASNFLSPARKYTINIFEEEKTNKHWDH